MITKNYLRNGTGNASHTFGLNTVKERIKLDIIYEKFHRASLSCILKFCLLKMLTGACRPAYTQFLAYIFETF